jgi:hypothetical protein
VQGVKGVSWRECAWCGGIVEGEWSECVGRRGWGSAVEGVSWRECARCGGIVEGEWSECVGHCGGSVVE